MPAFLAYLIAHPRDVVEVLLAALTLLTLIAGATPRSAQRWPWIGWLVRFARRFGVATHRDEPGTLSWPGVIEAALYAARASDPPAVPPASNSAPKVPPLPLLLCLALALGACAPRPWQDSAHIAINAAAHGLAAADGLVSGAITRDARDPARTSAQLDATWQPAITAMGALRAALVAAQGAVDAAAATHADGDRCHALALVARARALAEDLATALRAAGLAVPDEVPRAIRLAGDLAASLSPRCEPEVPDAG
jgi:hypothetical protein